MKVTVDRIVPSCPDGKTCPTLAHTDCGTGIVVGKIVRDPEVLGSLGIGPDEMAVEVPPSLAVWSGTEIVAGTIVRDPEVLGSLGIGPDEMAVEVPPSLAVWKGDQHAQ